MPRERSRHMISFPKTGRTKQSFTKECDINTIINNWKRTGQLSHVSFHEGHYGDFTDADDYLASRLQLQLAQDAFMALPSNIREEMGNDPGTLLEFLADPANDERAIELRLKEAPEPPPRGETPTDPPAPSPVSGGD